ncbi:MAG: hypothetical protein IJF54_04960 [Clostridia bacterium]|nr:hypothetical protein [Clostridia bacterium]
MKKRNIIILISVLSALVLLISGIMVYKHFHSISYKYNDRFVLGNTIENIKDKYGEFDILLSYNGDNHDEVHIAGYIIREQYKGLLHYNNDEYYMIHFEDGIAVKVSMLDGNPGG